jgi:hypothetical protein
VIGWNNTTLLERITLEKFETLTGYRRADADRQYRYGHDHSEAVS